jgi:enoyl-CoA hydratase/carnithine racemase
MSFYDDLVAEGRAHEEPVLHVQRHADRAVVTLDDRLRLNAVSAAVVQQLKAAPFAYYAGGEHLDADKAMELGLVHEVVADEDLLGAADTWCTRIAALPPHAIAMAKPLLRAACDGSWENTLAMEEFAEPQCFTSDAFQAAVKGMLGS